MHSFSVSCYPGTPPQANELLARFSAPLFSPQQLEARRSYRALIASDAVSTKAELEAAKVRVWLWVCVRLAPQPMTWVCCTVQAKKPLHKAPSLHRKLAELSVMRVASSDHARASSPTLGRVRASSPSPTPSPASSPLRHPGRPFFDHDDAVVRHHLPLCTPVLLRDLTDCGLWLSVWRVCPWCRLHLGTVRARTSLMGRAPHQQQHHLVMVAQAALWGGLCAAPTPTDPWWHLLLWTRRLKPLTMRY